MVGRPIPRLGSLSGGGIEASGFSDSINPLRNRSLTAPTRSTPVPNQGGRFGLPTDIFAGYQPPAQQSPQYPAYNPPSAPSNTPSFGIGAPDSGGYGGSAQPAPQAKPVMSEADWLAGDSDYQNQMTDYGTALSDFLARLTRQKNDFTQDYNVAKQGLDRNETQGLLNLGEDFTSRGLANSGLFANSRQEAQTNFQNQRTGMNTARDRALADFGTQERDKRTSTTAAQNNAKRASLGRMAMRQAF